MHLPIDAQQRTVRVNDGGGVVINAGGPLLEQRGNDDDPVFFRQFLESIGARPGNFLRQLEILVVLALAEILRAEQLLRADDLRAVFRGALDERDGLFKVRVRIGRHAGLDEPEFDFG